MTDDAPELAEALRSLIESSSTPLDAASFVRREPTATSRRRRTAALAVSAISAIVLVGAIGIALAVRGDSVQKPRPAASPKSTSVSATTSSTSVTSTDGIAIKFSVATSSPLLDRVTTRLNALIRDEKQAGLPPSPAFCTPSEEYTGTIAADGTTYRIDGTVSLGSNAPIRVEQYGSNDRFVYVLARVYNPRVTGINIRLTHPMVSGRMTSLGDRYFIFAAKVGTGAPWYTTGALLASNHSGTDLSAVIPEDLRSTPC